MSRLESFFAERPQARLVLAIGLIVMAALSRLLPHPPNFSPVAAIALFAGAVFVDRRLAYAIPLVAMLISDALIGFHDLVWLVYACMAFSVWLGHFLQKRLSVSGVATTGLISALVFFLATNFAVWLGSGMYPPTIDGLIQCFTLAIPFFKNEFAGVAVYSTVLFGAWYALGRTQLRQSAARI